MIRLADYVVQFLLDQGVKDIFTVPGGGAIFLCDALALNKEMNYVCCHHEQAAAIAGEAYARVRDSLGVTLVTSGPGGTNAITGVAGSWIDSVPHLCISGQVFSKQTIGDSALRQLGVQELNIIDLVKPITKYAVMVNDPKSIRYHLEKAIYLAKSGRPGPVWLDLPADIQNAKIDPLYLKGYSSTEAKPAKYDDVKEKVSQVVRLLKQAKRPLLHVGQGVRLAGATETFFQLVESKQIPFVTARNANDIVASDHPLFVGRPGTFAQRGANFAVQNADLYIAVGTRLNLSQTGYNSQECAKNSVKVMVDIDASEMEKKTLSIDIKIHSDAKEFLTELIDQLRAVEVDTIEWKAKCAEWKKKYSVVLPEYKDQKGSINSYYFTDVLSDVLSCDDVIVTDMGISFQGTHQALRVKEGQRFFTNSGFASMGWGLPAAVGACIGSRKRRTICISGEGGLMMNLQELSTVTANNLPVKLFILNNGGYMTIKQTQELGFDGRLMGVDAGTGLDFPDFIKIAAAHGIPALRLDSHEGLEENLREVLAIDGPAICEIMMDHDQLQIPKAINRRNADGSMSPTSFEDLWPFVSKEELAHNMLPANRLDLSSIIQEDK